MTPISVVLAAKDEAATIADIIARCRCVLPEAEMLVVDDGSTDNTAEVAAAAGATVHRLAFNCGKGVALREGFARASGELLVLLDADGQDDPEEIPTLLEAMHDDVALVIGSRFLGQFDADAITPLNRAGTHFFNALMSGLFRQRFSDTQAGFRVLRASALRKLELKAERYEIETEVLLALVRAGEKVVEVPVRRHARSHGETNLSPWYDGLRILKAVLRLSR